MEDELLREVGQECFRGFQDDEDSRSEWLDMHTFWLSLYSQMDYAENSDPERAWGATESIPVLTEACDQFQSRTYKAFFPTDTFVSALPMQKVPANREALEARAKRIADHMSWQLGYQDRNYKQDKDALFLGVPLHGSFFTKTYLSDKLKRAKVDNVRPTDLVINYHSGPIRIEDVRRKSHIIRTTIGDTQRMVNSGFLTDACKPCMQDGKSVYDVKVEEISGIKETSVSLKSDRGSILIEQHLWLDLEDNNNFLPYIVTFDLADHRVKRMTVGWESDPTGKPLKDYEQVQYFTHYKFKENPDGFYGYGLGHSMGDINSAINIMLRQIMDAATLANDGNSSGFISDRLGLEGDEIRMVLGKFTKIEDTLGDFQNGIMKMEFPGPSEALFKAVEMLDARAQRLGSNTEATTGTMDKVIQPTTYLTQLEQALEPLSSAQMRLSSSLGDELQKIYRLNQRYLPLLDYYMVNGAPEVITRSDYADDMMIVPIFDPKFATQGQKIARAQAIAQVVMANPLTQTRPQVMDELTRRNLVAMDADNIEELVPIPPPPQRIDDQNQENMLFMMPPGSAPPFDVFPDQNHAEHLAKMEPFVMQEGGKLMPEQAQAVMAHKMKHEAMQYGQRQGIIPTQQGGNPALAAGQGDQMGAGPAALHVPAPPLGGSPGNVAPGMA